MVEVHTGWVRLYLCFWTKCQPCILLSGRVPYVLLSQLVDKKESNREYIIQKTCGNLECHVKLSSVLTGYGGDD